jgi:hypothetical protein
MTRLIASEWADNVGYGAGEMLMVHCVSAPQLTRLAARYPRGIGGPAVPENDSVWLLFGMAACLGGVAAVVNAVLGGVVKVLREWRKLRSLYAHHGVSRLDEIREASPRRAARVHPPLKGRDG